MGEPGDAGAVEGEAAAGVTRTGALGTGVIRPRTIGVNATVAF